MARCIPDTTIINDVPVSEKANLMSYDSAFLSPSKTALQSADYSSISNESRASFIVILADTA